MKVKKGKNIKDITIQETNDSSILSKASIVGLGYFDDPYLALFTTRVPRRAPLIHRGYYIRAKAIDHALRSFILNARELQHERIQIVSLGAGFDTSYFRLKDQKLLHNCRYIEIDFPDVMRRKQTIIQQHQVLKHLIGDYDVTKDHLLKTDDFVMLPCDLTDLKKLELLIGETGIRSDIPTLFFSECVLTYVENEQAENLLKWISEKFLHSVVVVYEQISPGDAFGVVMMNHFEKIQSPLRRIHRLRTLERHVELLSSLCYENNVGLDMNFFYTHYLDEDEKSRFINLEPFDEYEEWHLKCLHYCIVAGFTGDCKSISNEMFPFKPFVTKDTTSPATHLSQFQPKSIDVSRFGHRCVQLTASEYLITGGFGVTSNGGHSRINTGAVVKITDDSITQTEITGLDKIMYHTMTRISENRFLVIGGRNSPKSPVTSYGTYEFREQSIVPLLTKEDSDFGSRWRHSAAFYKGNVVIYGGCTVDNKVLGDFWCVRPHDLSCSKLTTPGGVVGRHSHSTDVWKDDTMILYGGLQQNMEAINQLHFMNLHDDVLTTEEVHFDNPLPARYSHTCHIKNNTMFVVGGIEPMGSVQPPLLLLNLVERTNQIVHMPACDPSRPIMLHNHQSVFIHDDDNKASLFVLGGGGNCFSFGTHFNGCIVAIDLPTK